MKESEVERQIKLEQVLRAYIDRYERSMAALARKLRVDRSIVHRWVVGERPLPQWAIERFKEEWKLTEQETAELFELAGHPVFRYNSSTSFHRNFKNNFQDVRLSDNSEEFSLIPQETKGSGYVLPDPKQVEVSLRIREPVAFFGREDELGQGKKAILEERLPILVYGPPGSGKSTTISKLVNLDEVKKHFEGEVLGFKLEETSTLDDIIVHFARLLGYIHVLEVNSQITKLKLLSQALHITRPNHLIVLDNADENQHIDALIRFRDEVSPRIIAGSRTRFELPLQDESYLEIADFSQEAALNLFVQRARLLDSNGRQITEVQKNQIISICKLLGNLPLAIVLAAGSLIQSSMSIEDLREYLSIELLALKTLGGMSRDTNILVSFGVSYKQLTVDEKVTFETFGAIALNGATVEEFAAITGLEHQVQSKVSLRALSNRSLAEYVPETQRYRMHPLIHAYARRRLLEREGEPKFEDVLEDTIIWRMISYYSKFARDNKNNFRMLDAMHDNLIQAIQWAYQTKAFLVIHEFWKNLDDWLDSIGDSENSIKLIKYAIEANEQLGRLIELSEVLNAWSTYLELKGETEAAKQVAERSLELSYKSKDQKRIASALSRLGYIMQGSLGELVRGHELLEEAWVNCKDIPEWDEVAYIAYLLGQNYSQQNHFDEAIKWYEKSLEIAKTVGSLRYEAFAVTSVGNWFVNKGRLNEAYEHLQRSRELKDKLGNKYSVAITLGSLAQLEARRDNLSIAQDLQREAISIYEEVAAYVSLSQALQEMADLLVKDKRYEEAITYYEQARSLSLKTALKSRFALVTYQLGNCYENQNHFIEAQQYYRESLASYESLGESYKYQIGFIYQKLGDLSIKQGEFVEAQKQYERARSFYEEYLAINEELKNVSGAISAFNALRGIMISLGNYVAIDKYLERLVEFLNQQNERQQVGTVLYNTGVELFGQLIKKQEEQLDMIEYYKLVYKYYEQSLVINEELKDSVGIRANLEGLRRAGIILDDYVAMDKYLEQLVDMLNQQGEREQVAAVLHNTGVELYSKLEKSQDSSLKEEQYRQAYIYCERSLTISDELHNISVLEATLGALVSITIRLGDYVAMDKYLERLVEVLNQQGKRNQVATALHNTGLNIYSKLEKSQDSSLKEEQYRQARTYCERSLTIREELHDISGITATLRVLVRITTRLDDYVVMDKYLEQLVDMLNQQDKREQVATVLHNTGVELYSKLEKSQDSSLKEEQYRQVRTYYERSLTISEELHDISGITATLGALREITTRLGDYVAMDKYLEQLVDMLNQQGRRNQAAAVLFYAGAELEEKLGQQIQFLEKDEEEEN